MKHPLLALERIHSVCKANSLILGGGTTADRWFHDSDRSYQEGADFEEITKERIGNPNILKKSNLNELALCGFSSEQYFLDNSNWFIPNAECVRQWLECSWFKVEELIKHARELLRDWNVTGIKKKFSPF